MDFCNISVVLFSPPHHIPSRPRWSEWHADDVKHGSEYITKYQWSFSFSFFGLVSWKPEKLIFWNLSLFWFCQATIQSQWTPPVTPLSMTSHLPVINSDNWFELGEFFHILKMYHEIEFIVDLNEQNNVSEYLHYVLPSKILHIFVVFLVFLKFKNILFSYNPIHHIA